MLVIGLLLVLPLIVTCAWLYENDRWAPTLDLAATELRVRDVGTVHTPLVGLFGRFEVGTDRGSHPGPLSFYLLAPIYRLLGGSYWALRVSTAALNAAAIACALSIARRRAEVGAVFATGLGIATLELGFGLLALTEPWNPQVVILWFVVFLLAVWSVASDDPWMFPVAAATGSLCGQTHIPYAAVCGGIGLLALVPFALFSVRAARRGAGRAYRRAFVAAVVAVAVLWAPPIIDQATNTPGNISLLLGYFRNSKEPMVGVRPAALLLLEHLDAIHILIASFIEPAIFTGFMHPRPPTPGRGAVCLVLWAIAVLATMRLRHGPLSALHGVIAVSLLVCLAAISRITGFPLIYLTYNAWVVGVSMVVATVSTAGVVLWRQLPERFRPRMAPMAAAVGVLAVGACAFRLAMDVSQAGSHVPAVSSQLAALAPAAADALLRGNGNTTGINGRYLVTWAETLRLAGEGWGLVDELERRGLDVGVASPFKTFLTKHRVRDPEDATARVHLATGGWIDQARTIPGAVQVAYWDGRSPEARQEFEFHRASVIDALRAIGRQDVADALDRQLDSRSMVPGLDPLYAFTLQRMAQIGVPAAVFVLPAQVP